MNGIKSKIRIENLSTSKFWRNILVPWNIFNAGDWLQLRALIELLSITAAFFGKRTDSKYGETGPNPIIYTTSIYFAIGSIVHVVLLLGLWIKTRKVNVCDTKTRKMTQIPNVISCLLFIMIRQCWFVWAQAVD